MNRIAYACLAVAGLMTPANAATLPSGEILITQAAVNTGGVTPGDTPGFPVTISVSGSYRVASNLIVTTAVNGIEVRANEVTIDMGGFTLAGSGVGRNGIASFNRNLKVERGTIRGFTNDGVRTIAQFLSVGDMVITANGRNGVFADNNGFINDVGFASVVSSRVTGNSVEGIQCANDCRVENSAVSENGGYGIIFKGYGGLALGNIVTQNVTGIYFVFEGGAGNNTVVRNGSGAQIVGSYIPMQPNACNPVGCGDPPP